MRKQTERRLLQLAVALAAMPHLVALGMELVVVPLLFAWQRRVARRFRT